MTGTPRMRAGLPGRILLAVCALLATAVSAQSDWPTKPVRVVVGFPAGTAADLLARLLAERLGAAFGQAFVVDNRLGQSGSISASAVARAPADGYTAILCGVAQLAGNPHLYKNLPYDPLVSFAPVTTVAQAPLVLVAGAALNVGSVAELVSLARTHPGKINFGSSGSGTAPHLTMELLKSATGINLVHVPYKGGTNVQTALMGGDISVAFDTTAVMPLVKAGKLRALAVSSANRSALVPDVPAVAETLPGFNISIWYGFLLPAGAPVEIVEKLNAEIRKYLASAEGTARVRAIGAEPMGGTPEALRQLVKVELDRWGKAVEVSGAKLD